MSTNIKYTVKKLDNGARIVFVPKKSNVVTMGFFVDAGSKNETSENNGVSHYLEHVLFKSTANRTPVQLFTELESAGITYNAVTTEKHTYYYLSGSTDNTLKMLDILLDIYLNPLFIKKEVNTERRVIIEEMRMYADMNFMKLFYMCINKLYKGTYIEKPIIGKEEIIDDMKIKDLIAFYNALYIPSNTVFVFVGGFNPKIVYNNLKNVFEGIKFAEKVDPKYLEYQNQIPYLNDNMVKQTEPYISIKLNEFMRQTYTLIAFPLWNLYEDKNVEINMLTHLLSTGFSSRLMNRLREENGITYNLSVYPIVYNGSALFVISLVMNPVFYSLGIKITFEELERLKEELITKDEIARIKNYTHDNLMLYGQHSIMTYLGTGLLDDPNFVPKIDEEIEHLKSLKRGAIRNLAKKIFVKNKVNIFTYGNINLTDKEYAKLLKNFN